MSNLHPDEDDHPEPYDRESDIRQEVRMGEVIEPTWHDDEPDWTLPRHPMDSDDYMGEEFC